MRLCIKEDVERHGGRVLVTMNMIACTTACAMHPACSHAVYHQATCVQRSPALAHPACPTLLSLVDDPTCLCASAAGGGCGCCAPSHVQHIWQQLFHLSSKHGSSLHSWAANIGAVADADQNSLADTAACALVQQVCTHGSSLCPRAASTHICSRTALVYDTVVSHTA